MSGQMYLSVIVPAYNERQNLESGVLDELYQYLVKQPYQFEIFLADDGSNDGTAQAMEAWSTQKTEVSVLKLPHRGKASTVASGMLAAHGQWRLFTDFDQSTPISELEKLLPFTQQGYQVIIGSREGAGALRDKEPWYRHLMGRVFNLVVQFLIVRGINDTQCGFKLLSAQATQLFDRLQIYGHAANREDAFTGAFDVELLFLARKQGFKIKEVPIVWRHRATARVSPIKDSIRMFRDVVRVRLAYLTGAYAHQ